MSRRVAVYAAPPPGSALHGFASAWLGRDAETGAAVEQPVIAGLAADRLLRITSSPRHYGFHATLKAPFAAADGITPEQVHREVGALARQLRPTSVPLVLGSLSGFLALVPAATSAAVQAIADACTVELDHLRAPPSEAELAQRRQATLSAREHEHLARFGYPYVLGDFRYHMTLTGRLAEPGLGRVRAILAGLSEPLCAAPFLLDALVVFEQPAREAPFVVTGRYRLAG